MVSLLLIILYTLISIFFLLKISRSYRNSLSAQQVALSFVVKISFGLAYGFIFKKFYNGDDTWLYHNFSLIEFQNLIQHPGDFFQNLKTHAQGNTSFDSIYDSSNSFWNRLDDLLLIKLLALFNCFSLGYYYVNVVLFCFLVYLGQLLLFRLLVNRFPASSALLTLAIFYNPMVIFWLSGIRKEGIILLGLALVLFYFDRLLRKEGNVIKNIFFLILGFTVVVVMRNFVAMCLLPSLAAWFFSQYFRWNAPLTFAAVYAGSIFIFFTSAQLPGWPDLAGKLTQRQYDFLALKANTRLPLDSLKGTAGSFLQVLPQAVNHAFFRPYITESKGVLQVVSAINVVLFYLFVMVTIFFRETSWRNILKHQLVITCFCTSLFAYLLIGYTVPFPGAFVRYKAIFELLFCCILAVCTDFALLNSRVVLIKNHILSFIRK